MANGNDPTRVSPIDLVITKAMVDGRHINYTGLLKLHAALTDESNVLGWDPRLFETREALVALVTDAIHVMHRQLDIPEDPIPPIYDEA